MRRRQPQPELVERIEAVALAVAELRTAEDSLERARARFREALREARAAGASFALLGRVVGLSRQRVARLVGEALQTDGG